jgi:pimeloyl-ACP methyl ester carboxylesterase
MGASKLPKDWDEDHSLELEARDILAVLQHLGSAFSRVSILGWSMGGHITQVLLTLPDAKEHPKGGLEVSGIHFEKAILAATMTKLPRGDFKPDVLEDILSTAGTDPEWKRNMVKVMMEYQYDPKWISASPTNKKLFDSRVENSLNSRRPQKIITLQGASIAQVDTRPDLPNVPASLPVLIIHGRLDRMVAYSESEHIVKNIKHAQRFDPGRNGDQYGHFWFDYFDTAWWADEIESYLSGGQKAKL